MADFAESLENANSLSEIFDLVKEGVRLTLGKNRPGLMLGLAELGFTRKGFVGGFYPVSSNMIVMNKTILHVLKEIKPHLLKPYSFLVLLHEYLHTLGFHDETYVRQLSFMIARELFGEEHLATKVAGNFNSILPELSYLPFEAKPPVKAKIEIVENFDNSELTYIG